MPQTRERREAERAPAEEFSPEYLAMLVVCGGSVRESDWALLPPALASRRRPGDSSRTLPATSAPTRR